MRTGCWLLAGPGLANATVHARDGDPRDTVKATVGWRPASWLLLTLDMVANAAV